jgi:pyrimidine-specific ribonucleoside hydrolase
MAHLSRHVTLAAMSVRPIPLVVVTDPGIDDAVALLLALGAPEARMLAVTAVFGNADVPTTTANAGRLLAIAGRPEIPLAAGAARPLVFPAPPPSGRHGADGLAGGAGSLPEPCPPDPRGAVPLLADLLRAADEPVTVAALGPLTDVALLLASHPQLARRISRVVAMGGRAGGAETNLRADPEAAHRVLVRESVPVTLVPLDLTVRCAFPDTWLDELADTGPTAALLASIAGYYRDRYRAETGVNGVPLHDAIAVLEAVLPGTLRTRPMRLAVGCAPIDRRGVLLDPGELPGGLAESTRPVHVAVDVALPGGIPALHAEILRRLTALP